MQAGEVRRAALYTVKQLSNLTGVSVRTLHYYDEISLLKPSKVGTNGYRYYDDQAMLRLQQILFYREVGLELEQIKVILDSPDFDLLGALRTHRAALKEKIDRLQKLVGTVDSTIMHLAGAVDVSKKRLFEGFSQEKQEYYERVARLQYGPTLVNESIKRWNSYSKAQQEAVREEGGKNYLALVEALKAGLSPQSAEVQAILERWHEHMRYFYEPTLDILRGLGEHYSAHPEFRAFFEKLHPDLPDYLTEGITQYVDDLESAEIERMLAEDEAHRLGSSRP
jgi:MerR family transcriptional regulator, thiopeptide resistance regulator